MISFLEYYEMNEVLTMTKNCNNINIIKDDDKRITVDVGRDIELDMTIRTLDSITN